MARPCGTASGSLPGAWPLAPESRRRSEAVKRQRPGTSPSLAAFALRYLAGDALFPCLLLPPNSMLARLAAFALFALPLASAAQTQPLVADTPVGGTLDVGDSIFGDGSFFDLYTFTGTPGETVVITLRSSDFDAYLIGGPTMDEALLVMHEDDDSGGGTDAELTVEIGASGEYVVLANTYEEGGVGAYVLVATVVAE